MYDIGGKMSCEPAVNGLPEIKVLAMRLPKFISPEEIEYLLSFVSANKRERILKLKKREDACRTLLADILVRWQVALQTGSSPFEIVYEYNKFGKPLISKCDSGHSIEFNVSHSGDWVVAAFDSNPVGIDLEKIEPINVIAIGRQFFSKSEYQSLISKDVVILFHFYELWALKESYIKCLGCGLSKPLHSFSVVKHSGFFYTALDDSEREQHFLRTFDLDEEYKSAICSKKLFQENIQLVDYTTLVNNIGKLNS